MKKKSKIDYEAMALFHMAKKHYKKYNDFVKALYEHYKVNEDDEGEIDLWCPTIEQESFSKMNKDRIRWTKILQEEKRKTKRGTKKKQL